MKRIKGISFFMTMVFLITGCSLNRNKKNVEVPETRYLSEDSMFCYKDDVHFISAPKASSHDSGISSFDVSYNMIVKDTFAGFAIGDSKGEYGDLIICELGNSGELSELRIKIYSNGSYKETVSPKAVSDEIEADEEKVLFDGISDTEGFYQTYLSIRDGLLEVTVNGSVLSEYSIPSFDLGTVGVYKSRGTSTALVDDIDVTCDGETIFSDDFDGSFINKLYEYNYSDEAQSAFSPYYFKTKEYNNSNALIVSSGFLLSETGADAAPVFKLDFKADIDNTTSAKITMTALGCMEIYLNDVKVTENYFEPGQPVYSDYLSCVSYDVTDLLKEDNTIKVFLFHGFYDRGVGNPESRSPWGDTLAIKGMIELFESEAGNASTKVIPTDSNWKVSTNTQYRYNDIYNGEIIDDRYEPTDADFENVEIDNVNQAYLNSDVIPLGDCSVKASKECSYTSVSEPQKGHFVYDFGNNSAGTASIDLSQISDEVKPGQVVTLRYGEVLNADNMTNADGDDGTIFTQNLLSARATDYYVFGADKSKKVSFDHTYHGFRYVEVIGLDDPLPQDAIKKIVLSAFDDKSMSGTFCSSNDLMNAYYECSINSLSSNIMCVPTDCPQRDERLGWAGDAQIVSGFSMYQFNGKEYYEQYLRALRSMQNADGSIPDIGAYKDFFGGHSCWGDAITVIAWNHYLHYADKKVLEDNYEAMTVWADYLIGLEDHDELINTGGYGDHLAIQTTDSTLLDTAWTYHSLDIVTQVSEILGYDSKYQNYEDEKARIKKAWQDKYIREDYSVEAGILYSEYESETAYALGIAFDIFPDEIKEMAASRLNLLAEYSGYVFGPGYAGMGYLLPVLAEYGYVDTAVKIITNIEPGGLCNPLHMGMTTLPEEITAFRMNDDGTYYLSGSLNHAAFSSVSEFFYTSLLGIQPDKEAPGFEHFYLKPCIYEGGNVSGSYKCKYGTINISWDAAAKKLSCSIPDGTTCTLVLPGGEVIELETGSYDYNW
ncbi:family 78 glycoside hydrolase catalytic domain [Butyrivibrio fibrisolvens]|uniref:family 78 glycoside hydrolase catalytic domain n=1 Tax=Butyrivibrio fibrisolvens TaxID=831 RepID=UPI0009B78394|nr:family 78 glycoside hydrolase catalytic domain [Butyrivibrio fibrisolvens]